jgi:hypothetical protein
MGLTDFVATGCRANSRFKEDKVVTLVFSCGPTDGLVTITMTKADFIRDFVDPWPGSSKRSS